MPEFDAFVAVDWSGAKGKFHKGIKVAFAENGQAAPKLIEPPHGTNWSRLGVVNLLNDLTKHSCVLVGFDFSFSGPFLDKMSYFPDTDFCGTNIKAQWQDIENICKDDADIFAGSIVSHLDYSSYFLKPNNRGAKFERRFRVTEALCRDKGFGQAESMFHLIGPSQVGLGSYAGMRALRLLNGFSIWPFHELGNGSVAIEIFTRLFLKHAKAGSQKIRTREGLSEALKNLNSKPVDQDIEIDDHATDAIVSAAGIRAIHKEPKVWSPHGLSDKVRETEGWTFGVK